MRTKSSQARCHIALTDAVIRLRGDYYQVRVAALAGRLGPVERRNGRLYLLEEEVERAATEGFGTT